MLTTLPDEILQHIIQYLVLKDVLSLVSVNKRLYAVIPTLYYKYNHIIYIGQPWPGLYIHGYNAIAPYAIPFPLENNTVKAITNHCTGNVLDQYYPHLTYAKITDVDTTNVERLDHFCKRHKTLHTLILHNNFNLPSCASFAHVPCIDLSATPIENVACLRHARYLNLQGTCVSDVSMLGHVHTLILAFCLLVEDVSQLHSVRILDLTDCIRVKDVSQLHRVQHLNISGTNVTDVRMLTRLCVLVAYMRNIHLPAKNVYLSKLILTLTRTRTIPAYSCLQTLDVSHTQLTDLSALLRIVELDISCTKVDTIPRHMQARVLRMAYCPVQDVSMLGQVQQLDISHTLVHDVSALHNVSVLNLAHTPVTDVSTLTQVIILNIEHTTIENVDNLLSVTDLGVSFTPLKDLHALPKLQKVYSTDGCLRICPARAEHYIPGDIAKAHTFGRDCFMHDIQRPT